jgi:hypothetical protein
MPTTPQPFLYVKHVSGLTRNQEKVPIPGKQSLVGKIGSMFTNTSSTVPEKKGI